MIFVKLVPSEHTKKAQQIDHLNLPDYPNIYERSFQIIILARLKKRAPTTGMRAEKGPFPPPGRPSSHSLFFQLFLGVLCVSAITKLLITGGE